MANIIAIVWDFDKTLVDGYMQDPIFAHYGADGEAFWREVDELPRKYWEEQRVKTNRDTIYLNHFINRAHDGTFPGLNNALLRELGGELKFYPGIPAIFEKTRRLIEDDPAYAEYSIRVEHYVVSTGMAEMIRGSAINGYVKGIWGCELIEHADGVIAEIGYSIDNTSKTRALFEINKGANVHSEINVNDRIAKEMRRVPFENMIYIADGPSDVPAFSVVNQNGGATFAVYPAQNQRAFNQVEQLRRDGRIHMYAEADYTEGTTAYMWIAGKACEIAERIRSGEKERLTSALSGAPIHLK